MPLVHHELCFGCGRTNLFGLLLEVDRSRPEALDGRCFIKQDHQGPDRGSAHEGIVASALCEAMALACGLDARASSLEVRFEGRSPVGTFVDVNALVERTAGTTAYASASASVEGRAIASARGTFVRG